ncbi:hypothetical protein GILI108418_15345 [Gillisia limnaea]
MLPSLSVITVPSQLSVAEGAEKVITAPQTPASVFTLISDISERIGSSVSGIAIISTSVEDEIHSPSINLVVIE